MLGVGRFLDSMTENDHSALLIVAHGSTVNPDSSAPTLAHAAEIRRIYGYRDFTNPVEGFRLVRWLYTRAWLSSEQPSVLFDLATARCHNLEWERV